MSLPSYEGFNRSEGPDLSCEGMCQEQERAIFPDEFVEWLDLDDLGWDRRIIGMTGCRAGNEVSPEDRYLEKEKK